MSRFLCLVVCLAFIGCQRYEETNNKAGDENQKGMGFFEKKDFETAISCFTEAIRLDPSLALAYMSRGVCYREKGDSEKARADMEKAKRLGFTPRP